MLDSVSEALACPVFYNRCGTFPQTSGISRPLSYWKSLRPVSGRDDHTTKATGQGKFIEPLEEKEEKRLELI